MTSKVADQWVQVLGEESWDDDIHDAREYARRTQLVRLWDRVLDVRNLAPNAKILEVGCGSGNQLVPFAARGFQVTGLDVSPAALERFRKILVGLNRFRSKPLSVSLLQGDFVQMRPTDAFAFVFSFGVIEHFLDRAERLEFLRHMLDWTSPGGVCVNFVPNGMQPLRQEMRERKLGGYNIPEIDYSIQSLGQDMQDAGFSNPRVVPLDLFAYRLVLTPPRTLAWWFYRLLNLLLKVLPQQSLSRGFCERHAYILAVVAERPRS